MRSLKRYFYSIIITTTLFNTSHAHQAKLENLTSLKNIGCFSGHPTHYVLAAATNDGDAVTIYNMNNTSRPIITIPAKTKKNSSSDWPQKFTAVAWLGHSLLALGDNKAMVTHYSIDWLNQQATPGKTFEIFHPDYAPTKSLPVQKIEVIEDYWSVITGIKNERAWRNNIVFKKETIVSQLYSCCLPYIDSTIGSQPHLKRPARFKLGDAGDDTYFSYLGLGTMTYIFRDQRYDALAFYKPTSNIIILGKPAKTNNNNSKKIHTKDLEQYLPEKTIVIKKPLTSSDKPQMCFFEMEHKTFVYAFEVKADITTLLNEPNMPLVSGNKNGLIEFWLIKPEQKEHLRIGEIDTRSNSAIKKVAFWGNNFISLDEQGNLKLWKPTLK